MRQLEGKSNLKRAHFLRRKARYCALGVLDHRGRKLEAAAHVLHLKTGKQLALERNGSKTKREREGEVEGERETETEERK